MPRRESVPVPEGNGPIPQYVLPGITLEDFHRIISEAMDKIFAKHFGKKLENPKDMRSTGQREASLEQNARQPRLATEADGPAHAKNSRAHGGCRYSSTSHAWG